MTSDAINLGAGADPPSSGWCQEPYGPKANSYWDGSQWTTWLPRSNKASREAGVESPSDLSSRIDPYARSATSTDPGGRRSTSLDSQV